MRTHLVKASWAAGLLACAAVVVWLGSQDPGAPAGSTGPAPDARAITVHLDGDVVSTVTPEELRQRRLLSDYLPAGARDVDAWKVLAASGEGAARFRVVNPAERFRGREVCLFLLGDGWPSIGVFRREQEGASPEMRAALAAPRPFLGKVLDVEVWTVEEPAPPAPTHAPTNEPPGEGALQPEHGSSPAAPAAPPVRARRPSAEEQKRAKDLVELGRLAPDVDARAQVVAGLDDEAEVVRMEAVRSLERWPDCVPDLYEHLLREDSLEIQRTCIKTIGRRGGAEYIDGLRSWAEGRPRQVLKEVDKALRGMARRAGLEPPESLRERNR